MRISFLLIFASFAANFAHAEFATWTSKDGKAADLDLISVVDQNGEKAGELKMNWPQLKQSKVEKFGKDFKYPGTGIPNLVLTDTDGKLIKGSNEGGQYFGPGVVMDHLEKLLKK